MLELSIGELNIITQTLEESLGISGGYFTFSKEQRQTLLVKIWNSDIRIKMDVKNEPKFER